MHLWTMPCTLWVVWALAAMVSLSMTRPPDRTTAPLSCDAAGTCDGRSRSLDSIPSGLTASVKSLDLANNNIAYVSKTDLQGCVNLKTLQLDFNTIHTIEEDSFHSLGRLEHLDLCCNQLSNLSSSWFQHLSSLKFLNLLGNTYRTLGEMSLFAPLTNLRVLRVGNVYPFAKIQRKDFTGLTFLEELELDASNLQQYEPASLKSFQNISRLVLHRKQPALLPEIFADLLRNLESLELRSTDLSSFQLPSLPIGQNGSPLRKLVFRTVEITDMSFSEILKLLNYFPRMVEVEFEDCTLNGHGYFSSSALGEISDASNLETLTIRRLQIPEFFLFNDLRSMYQFVRRFKRITIENSKVFLVPCLLSRHLKSLEYLDLTENLMVEEQLTNSACEEAWPALHTLILRQNHLRSLGQTGEVLLTLKNLTALDISKNSFHSMPPTCHWPEKIRRLNLSSTHIDSLTPCLPQTLEVLDVSNNNLDSFSLLFPRLRELYISRNKLKTLPDASFLPSLLSMTVSRNIINSFTKKQLDSFQKLTTLEAGGNSFICSCEFLAFTMQEQQMLGRILTDWPERYLCDSPSHVRGQQVRDTRLSVSECHRVALVSALCCALLLLALLTVGLCHRYHGLWYMKMTWAWLQAKRKPRRAPARELCYDAFVSYSEQDSYWVETLMVQELEHFEPPFRLCLHKRDFVPGKWIIDNIIDSIEKSHKTIFVLSEHFVKSEWCKYELDFSHFRLFDENNDAAILVLLEPLEKKAVPQRFCKLRKIMNTKTYLEWPQDEAQHQGFWLSLRAAIKA